MLVRCSKILLVLALAGFALLVAGNKVLDCESNAVVRLGLPEPAHGGVDPAR